MFWETGFFVAQNREIWVQGGLVLAIVLYLAVLLPRLKAGVGDVITALILVVLLATHFALLTAGHIHLQLLLPAMLLLIGHLFLVVRRFQIAEKNRRESGIDSLQNTPIPDPEQTRKMSATVVLDNALGKDHVATVVLNKAAASGLMLGRYAIEQELGKGSMGVVYLGRDTELGRAVAIKTMALAQEFDEDELEEVQGRFLREAESAGRLNHPNIVTIHDSGEEHDLAYIAMEFLKGRDLSPYTKPDNLLPLPKVLSIVARVADALDYAHSLNVVHRDIKPANIMYDPKTDIVKVTDFGIARITDSSRTKTGMVLGTPSFMSPEQLAGSKIGGGSDLFSLGVSLYQMLCGKLPFVGDSMAQLMFRITNEAPADILNVRPDVPPCVVAIIDRALAKQVQQRFQSGAEMAVAIRQCAGSLQINQNSVIRT